MLAGERPALADKHPILAAISGDALQVDVAHALAAAAPQRDFASVLNQLTNGVERQNLEGDDPSGATRPTLRRWSELRGGDNGITGTELIQVPSRFAALTSIDHLKVPGESLAAAQSTA